MERPTEYEILSKELGIIDRDTFLSNLEKLALVNKNAMILLKEIKRKVDKYVDIPEKLNREDMFKALNTYYNCFNTFTVSGIYHIITSRFGYEIDKNANTLNIKPVEDCVFRAYNEDYEMFLDCIHEFILAPMKWGFPFCPESVKEFDNNKEIKVPELPF